MRCVRSEKKVTIELKPNKLVRRQSRSFPFNQGIAFEVKYRRVKVNLFTELPGPDRMIQKL